MEPRRIGLIPAVLLAAAAGHTAIAGSARQGTSQESAAARYFTDVVLVNQDGREMRFYTDLLKGKAVVINTIFATCTAICPVISATLSRVQDHVGNRLGRDVHLISISVDPVTDTPERLKAFAARFGARPGWHFLTGSPENVKFALTKLGQWVDEKEAHTAIILIGNDRTGLWKKAFGLAPADELIPVVDSVLKDGVVAGEPGPR